ncbi:MAG: hypothetical protein O2779_01955 [Nanoarchaeota archaeon]|nr:hypothetical protein [Nanoarchaeota archaeon]
MRILLLFIFVLLASFAFAEEVVVESHDAVSSDDVVVESHSEVSEDVLETHSDAKEHGEGEHSDVGYIILVFVAIIGGRYYLKSR